MQNSDSSATKSPLRTLLVLTVAIVALDQFTKFVIMRYLPLHDAIPVIEGFFNITHIRNPGGAFGIFAKAGAGVRHFFFLGVTVFALGLVYYFYRTTPRSHPVLAFGFALIFSGAVGNLIDRVRFGEVVDFLDFYALSWHWPAFNVADSAITVGISICAYHFLFNKMP